MWRRRFAPARRRLSAHRVVESFPSGRKRKSSKSAGFHAIQDDHGGPAGVLLLDRKRAQSLARDELRQAGLAAWWLLDSAGQAEEWAIAPCSRRHRTNRPPMRGLCATASQVVQFSPGADKAQGESGRFRAHRAPAVLARADPRTVRLSHEARLFALERQRWRRPPPRAVRVGWNNRDGVVKTSMREDRTALARTGVGH
jgi:hypothetical protein